jgi:hypothetical protein
VLFIRDIVREEENKGLFPVINIGDISDETGDFSKRTDRQYPIFDPPDFPVSGGIPGGVGVFPGQAFPKFFSKN